MLELAIVCAALVVAIWLVYPLAVALLAGVVARGRAPRAGAAPLPRVSMILATREADAVIRDRVEDLLRADYPRELLEVVVGIDATRDQPASPSFPPRDVPVRVIAGDAPGGKASTLNAAVRAASGDVLVFADAAQRFAPDAVRLLVDALVADPRLGAVSGALDIGSDGRVASPAELYWRLERRLRRDEARIHSTVGVTGAIYAARRAAWAPLPAGVILDDVYGPMRMVLDGWRVGFCEEARAVDERRFGTEREYARKVRTLTGNIQLCAWLPGVLVPVRNPIWVQLICHKLLRLVTPYLVALGLVAAALALPALVARVLPREATLVLAALLALAIVGPALNRKVRSAVVAGLAMQLAVVHATINGLRGRWDVWHR